MSRTSQLVMSTSDELTVFKLHLPIQFLISAPLDNMLVLHSRSTDNFLCTNQF